MTPGSIPTRSTDGGAKMGEPAQTFLEIARDLIDQLISTQIEAICRAAEVVSEALAGGRPLYVFGTGHSHMIAEEAYYRAGGLVQVTPIFSSALMLHEDAALSTRLERLSGFADALLDSHPIGQGDVLLITSNSGANAVSVELATAAKQRGARVVAITSITHATSPQARAKPAPRLHEIADVVIDNGGAAGDAAMSIEGLAAPVGPTSTITGAATLNAIVVHTVELLVRAGHDVPVYTSANLVTGDAHNAIVGGSP